MKTYNIFSIEDFKSKIEINSRLLGIDPGQKNIGFAICDERRKVATPLSIIKRDIFKNLSVKIDQIISENHIKGIVIGNPINMDGTEGESSLLVKNFAKELSKNVTIPIALWDERLSSEASFKITKDLGTNVSNRLDKLDKNAAAFILQGAIDYLSN